MPDLESIAVLMSSGSVSMGDWETLAHFAKGKDIVVELGCNTGSTALMLSYMAKNVFTVDVFEDLDLIEDETQRHNYKNHFAVNQNFYSSIAGRLYHRENILVHKGLTYESVRYVNAVSGKFSCVDLIFIDADHSYQGVKKDYEAWFDKVKVGGHFAFHDVGEGCPVFDFYNNELLNDARIVLEDFTPVCQAWTKVFRKV